MKYTNEDRKEIIDTIMEKEYVSQDCYDTMRTLGLVALTELEALEEQANIDGWTDRLLGLKKMSEHKLYIYNEVLQQIYVG